MKNTNRTSLRKTFIAASVAAAFSVSSQQAAANPSGPSGGVGVTGMTGLGTANLTINTSGNSALDWHSKNRGLP